MLAFYLDFKFSEIYDFEQFSYHCIYFSIPEFIAVYKQMRYQIEGRLELNNAKFSKSMNLSSIKGNQNLDKSRYLGVSKEIV